MPENRLKRPRDPAQLAKLMIDIASSEVEDPLSGRASPMECATLPKGAGHDHGELAHTRVG
jgi:hypothetical protein